MTEITFDAVEENNSEFSISSYFKKLTRKRPAHSASEQRAAVASTVAVAHERKQSASLHSDLAYECDSWLRWTNN